MSAIPFPPLPDEDECFERAQQKLLDIDMGLEPAKDELGPARGVIFGPLAVIALCAWVGFALWRWLL